MDTRDDRPMAHIVDDHIVSALLAADTIYDGDREQAEDYVRNRLVWAADSWQSRDALRSEQKRRQHEAFGVFLPESSDWVDVRFEARSDKVAVGTSMGPLVLDPNDRHMGNPAVTVADIAQLSPIERAAVVLRLRMLADAVERQGGEDYA